MKQASLMSGCEGGYPGITAIGEKKPLKSWMTTGSSDTVISL
jgi:hypothetical protein